MNRAQEHRFEARLVWTGSKRGPTADYATYSRELEVTFPGKPPVRMSSAPAFRGDPALANPEDLLVASLSACHALSYFALCARHGVHVLAYEDDAVGTMARGPRTFHFTDVLLRPRVTVAPGAATDLARTLHENAHEECFIASSVNFPVRHEATIVASAPV